MNLPPEEFIRLERHPVQDNMYDVTLTGSEYWKDFDTLECHIVVYPYSRKIKASHIHFNPYEEYANDLSLNQESAYVKIRERAGKLFGFLLGAIIFTVFFYYNPKDLFSVESIVAIFAAYAIGKDIWNDLDKILTNLTKNSSIRFANDYYNYELDRHSTMTNYSALAKKTRYGRISVMPTMMNFIEMSNSQTVRLFFEVDDLLSAGDSVHVLSIHIDPVLKDEFEKRGFLFGLKLSFGKKKFFFFQRKEELFQSIHNFKKGCLDDKKVWHEKSIFYRIIFTLGRLKVFYKNGVIPGTSMLNYYTNQKNKTGNRSANRNNR